MIFKSAKVSAHEFSNSDLIKINELTLEPLEEQDVFIFKVAMCDNEIDRHFEAFSLKTLNQLKSMYVGKTVIKDHLHSSDNQVARIYDTELITYPNKLTKNGDVYTQLVAHCYMLNNESNKDLIAEIKAGIKKEVSVGCSVNKSICSICGIDIYKSYCNHIVGNTYKNKNCYRILEGANDAYELSLVAVPAQPRAGTIKSFNNNEIDLQIKLLDIDIFIKSKEITLEV